MLKTLGVVEARATSRSRVPAPLSFASQSLAADHGPLSGSLSLEAASDRSPGRNARKIGCQTLLEWITRRATECQRLAGVVVLADAEDGPGISTLVPPDVPVAIRKEGDSLSRFCGLLESYSADAVVRIRDDSPFFDPALIDRLIATADEHSDCDYISYCSRAGRPAILANVGVFAEWFRVSAIRKADRLAVDPADRDDAPRFLYSHPEAFRLRLIPSPAQLDRDDVRLLVDDDEDWEHVQTIFDALGPEGLDWQRIAGFLDHQPRLRERMAALNRRG